MKAKVLFPRLEAVTRKLTVTLSIPISLNVMIFMNHFALEEFVIRKMLITNRFSIKGFEFVIQIINFFKGLWIRISHPILPMTKFRSEILINFFRIQLILENAPQLHSR